MERSREEIDYAFETFVAGLQTMLDNHYAEDEYLKAPEVVVNGGSKYWKVIRRDKNSDHGGASVFGFVRKEDGAILKAANWSAPFVKGPSAVRGYVTDPNNGLSSVTIYGVVYAS